MLEQRLKQQIGELVFSNHAMAVEIEQLKEEINQLKKDKND